MMDHLMLWQWDLGGGGALGRCACVSTDAPARSYLL